MTDKRLVVTGIVALVFTVPVLVGGRRCVKAICIGAAKAESTGAVNPLRTGRATRSARRLRYLQRG